MTTTPATMKPARTDATGPVANHAPSASETRQIVGMFEKLRKTTWTERFDRSVDAERNAFGRLVDPRDLPITRFAALTAQRLTSHGVLTIAEQLVDNPRLVATLQRHGWTPTEVAHIVLQSRALGLLE
jgi:hypothetical protein